nr:exportin-4 isoform X1 [Ipomoea batatas]
MSYSVLVYHFEGLKRLPSLTHAHRRSLAQTLVLSATGMRDSEMSYQYVKYLTSHMTAYLVELSGRNDLKKVAEQPDIILLVGGNSLQFRFFLNLIYQFEELIVCSIVAYF